MSVPVSKRQKSPHDVWQKMMKLKEYTSSRYQYVPKRRRRSEWEDIATHTYNAMHYISIADEIRIRNDELKQLRMDNFKAALIELQRLQFPLMVTWNISRLETKKMEFWANSINEVMAMVSGIILKESGENVTYRRIVPLHWKEMRNCEFVSKASEYHTYVHSKLTKYPQKSLDAISYSKTVNIVLCNVVYANRKIPATKAEYEYRKRCIDTAIRELESSQNTLFSLMYGNLSERVLNEWSGKLISLIKILKAIQKSDKQRFSDLQ